MKIIREVERLIKDRNKTAEEKKISRILAENTAEVAANATIQQKMLRCQVQLETCDDEFCEVIEHERNLIAEKETLGLSAEDSRIRIRDAALGRLVIRSALMELKNSTAENHVNEVMNQLGESLRRLYNLRGVSISKRNREAICEMLPEAANVEEVLAKIDREKKYTVPQELNVLVDENLVNDLIAGEEFEHCLQLGAARRAKKAEENDQTIHLLEENGAGAKGADVRARSDKNMKDVKEYSELLRKKGNTY